ncbi:MAG: hypothetical protein HOV97_16300 [Nonomuraea sp.]|nr:hypothetical protein [Nonomuraea sp.]
MTLTFGVFIVPGAAMWAAKSGTDLLPGPFAALGWGSAVVVTPFQAAVVARQFLDCMAWRTEVDDSDLAYGLPGGSPSRPVRARFLLATLVPGLLFGGVVLVNPFGWLEVAETRVAGSPEIVRAPGARLPGGRLLMTAWSHQALRLVACEAGTCTSAADSWNVTRASSSGRYTGVALAVQKDGGPVVAFADKERTDGDADPTHDVVSLIFCADVSCARPDPRRVARLDATAYLPTGNNLAVAMAPGDRPVLARFDTTNGQIHVISCTDAACLRPRVTSPVPASPPAADDRWAGETGLALAVRPDGRPTIAYRDLNDHATKLLDCRTPDCAQADVITLAPGGPYSSTPALILDRSGRPLVAYENRDGTRLMLTTCTGHRCDSIAVARLRDPGEALTMTANTRGEPAITWIADRTPPGGEPALVVTTPLNLGFTRGRHTGF